MGEQKIFKRYEVKFQLTRAQQEKVLTAMREHMIPDEHGRSTVQSLYYDTPDHLLIRRSIEKPTYKEKLRLRSYGMAGEETKVFLELKKKYKHVVYKRRISLTEAQAAAVMGGGGAVKDARFETREHSDVLERSTAGRTESQPAIPTLHGRDAQILREIAFTRDRYPGLAPSCLISCQREAWYGREDRNLRITFDSNILWRDTDLNLHTGIFGTPILAADEVLMEVKVCGGIPLWLLQVLSKEHIYKTSFSKYGRAYAAMLTGSGLPERIQQRLAESMWEHELPAFGELGAELTQGGGNHGYAVSGIV